MLHKAWIKTLFRGRPLVFLFVCFGFPIATASSTSAQTVWSTTFSIDQNSGIFQTVQKLDAATNTSEILIENRGELASDQSNPRAFAVAWSFSIHDGLIFSMPDRSGSQIERWDAATGEDRDPLLLSEPISSHTMGFGSPIYVDHAANGDLLITHSGTGTEQRSIARYSSAGDHIVNYTHPKLMHLEGSVVATEEMVFAISRHNIDGTWLEKVLTFKTDGTYVGELDVPIGDPTDLALWDDELVVIGSLGEPDSTKPGGINVYQLDDDNGLPTFSQTVGFPEDVHPESTRLDGIAYEDGLFYVSESRSSQIHQISRNGELLNTYTFQTFGYEASNLSQIEVLPAIQVPEPSSLVLNLFMLAGALRLRSRRR